MRSGLCLQYMRYPSRKPCWSNKKSAGSEGCWDLQQPDTESKSQLHLLSALHVQAPHRGHWQEEDIEIANKSPGAGRVRQCSLWSACAIEEGIPRQGNWLAEEQGVEEDDYIENSVGEDGEPDEPLQLAVVGRKDAIEGEEEGELDAKHDDAVHQFGNEKKLRML